jgi:hypothetical protein
MLRRASYLLPALLVLAMPATAQPGGDTMRVLAEAARSVESLGPTVGPATWPGYRPDTIPVAFVLPGRGVLLVHWRGALPDGFAQAAGIARAGWRPADERGAANTGVELGGHGVAQVVVHAEDAATLAGIAAHEAFHVFEAAARSPGVRFGTAENSFLVSTYPVFDASNEAGVALEGRLLREALDARTSAATRRAVDEWLAVREARQRRLGATLAEFEEMAELNEGTAEYALLRMRAAVAGRPAEEVPASLRRGLDSLTAVPGLSVRLRAYRTGPAIAWLLDRLEGPRWKDRLRRENLTLQDALAEASGYRAREASLVADARMRHGGGALAAAAEREVTELRALRAAQADSIRSAPGLLLRITSAELGRGIGLCGIDPQNLLRASETVTLHTRWVRLCAGPALSAEVTARSVHDEAAGTVEVPLGDASAVKVTVDGQPAAPDDGFHAGPSAVRIDSPAIALTSARARLERHGRVLVLTPLPAEPR